MLEYASSRFRFVWTIAARFPQASEMQTITASATVQSSSSPGKAVTSRRMVTMTAATLRLTQFERRAATPAIFMK